MLKALQASAEGQSDMTLPETPVVHEQLWVDKYAPSSFSELLSDEQTNREVEISFEIFLKASKVESLPERELISWAAISFDFGLNH